MTPPGSSQEQNQPQPMFGLRMLAVGGEVGCVTVLIVFASVFGGLWLDRLFGTKPFITIALVLASAPIALALTIWLAMRSAKQMSTPPKVTKPNPPLNSKEGGEDW